MTAHGFRELTPFFIAYISRRRTNQAAYGMLFHIFTHIDADDALFIVEEHFGKALGKFRLATPVGPRKIKEPMAYWDP